MSESRNLPLFLPLHSPGLQRVGGWTAPCPRINYHTHISFHGDLYLVMELATGGTLANQIEQANKTLGSLCGMLKQEHMAQHGRNANKSGHDGLCPQGLHGCNGAFNTDRQEKLIEEHLVWRWLNDVSSAFANALSISHCFSRLLLLRVVPELLWLRCPGVLAQEAGPPQRREAIPHLHWRNWPGGLGRTDLWGRQEH